MVLVRACPLVKHGTSELDGGSIIIIYIHFSVANLIVQCIVYFSSQPLTPFPMP